MDYEHKQHFQKKKYKYSLANEHMTECLTSAGNKKEMHTKVDVLFAINSFQGWRWCSEAAFANASIRRIK